LLNQEEKRALRDKQKLLFSSGQFPLQAGDLARRRALRKRRSPLKILIAGVVAVLFVLIALVILLTSQARADEGDKPRAVDFEVSVTGERPAPGVVFVDGGAQLLRKRMRALALEAGNPNASLDGGAKTRRPPADVRVLRADVTSGLVDRRAIARATSRAARKLGACFAHVDDAQRVRATVVIGSAGRGLRVTRAGARAKSPSERAGVACLQATLSAARWPAPVADDTGAATATVVVDLLVRPGAQTPDGARAR
jgi:hypothetical protein